jgi:YHS domain-containing protein
MCAVTEAVLNDHKYQLELQADHTVSAKNPVCELKVDPETTPHVAEHDDHTYCFCSVGCRTKFVAAPQNYVGDASRKQSDLTAETIYTCPMPHRNPDGEVRILLYLRHGTGTAFSFGSSHPQRRTHSIVIINSDR